MVGHSAGVIKPFGLHQDHLQLGGGVDVHHLVALARGFRLIAVILRGAALGEHVLVVVVVTVVLFVYTKKSFKPVEHLLYLLPKMMTASFEITSSVSIYYRYFS